jgi:D-beta-D-heptose 7-phosphate kinase/D-beta-D-heptose 1-phosphate adenosyltransferase|tara:strand:+ start:19181 stop:19924 length:744 start_codon:yes stop_codon:yes gene_type:complete
MKVLVIGDSCKDVYVYGKCERLCPDAPVPVFMPLRKEENQGMAGNVRRNLQSLGIECDIVTNESEVTKTRYVEEKTNHMIIRIDSGEEKIQRINNLHLVNFKDYDAVVISDYNKGFLTEEDIHIAAHNHELVFLDTKKWLGDWAQDITFIKINEIEYKKTYHTIKDKKWILENLIITVGSRGCVYKDKTYPVEKVEIKDLSGAGDSFLAALVYGYLKNRDIGKSIKFANRCATQVVQQKGVTIIDAI